MSSTTEPVGQPPDESPHREAARYRTRARDAEQRADELAARLEAVQRATVESMLTKHRITPQALWAITSLPELLSEDGCPDEDKVAAAVKSVREQLGINVNAGLYVPAENGALSSRSGSTFTDAFKQGRHP